MLRPVWVNGNVFWKEAAGARGVLVHEIGNHATTSGTCDVGITMDLAYNGTWLVAALGVSPGVSLEVGV